MTGSFEALAWALAVFLVTHVVPAVRPLRRRAVAAVGERAYLVLYSLVSLALLVWVIAAALTVPYVEVWADRPEAAWVPAVLMLASCILLVAGVGTPNPLSIGPQAGGDPERPGIVAVTRHPLLWALVL